ncbi:putative bifunctional diguanylate cyclase/phosphodiesterase [Rhabdochromatium marinum]|uniref:putative bifunctional diguanylate cyclase/phosphodiesterase n=1 Tax=Rhabdochromatium marinum TaxID=48729 RepID=UPI001F5BA4F0|nr:EAL domain-containing protein [Rhabdochromatium marinum]
MTDDNNQLIFVEDAVENPASNHEPWRVLVVDDEEDVHGATEIALRGLLIEGRFVKLDHAYSAQEAYQILTREHNITVILLDVVMESDDAGLRLVKRIREELNNQAIRIVMRTGQPGYAPLIETIRAYDINDYRTKSELTRVRLFTSLTVAIRSYRQIRQLEISRYGLELIISASTGLSKIHALRQYAEGIVTQLCSLLDIAPEGLICVASAQQDEPPRIIAAAGRYRELIQCPLEELPDTAPRDVLQRCLQSREHLYHEGICLYFDVGATRGIAAYVDGFHDIDAITRNLLEVFCTNVTVGLENVLLQERLYNTAYHDPLLHLPNRNRLIQLITERGADENMRFALVDLDDFAEINTVLDHRFGDRVLQAVADRLAAAFAPPAVLARIAGDTFGLLGNSEQITRHNIEQVFTAPFDVDGELIRISATASLVRLSREMSEGDAEVLKHASIALKQAKLLNRGRAEWFSVDLSVAARERIRMLTELRAAFSTDRLFLAYQPQVDLLSGKVLGAEALLRWQVDDDHSIPPDQFIPLAEQSGLMVPIGQWVLRTACHQLKHLIELGHSGFRMAINVSHSQFREPDFVTMLARVLDDCQVAAEQVELELTESIVIGHIESTTRKIIEIRRMGLSVAMDDFGTGYSSLNVLQQLDIDRLKIDRAFVKEIDQSGDSTGIADLVIALGHRLNLVTIAEGVENEEQRRHLLQLGCQEGQGYLFGRPLPGAEFEDWMSTQD